MLEISQGLRRLWLAADWKVRAPPPSLTHYANRLIFLDNSDPTCKIPALTSSNAGILRFGAFGLSFPLFIFDLILGFGDAKYNAASA
jgi:hypothetical protein